MGYTSLFGIVSQSAQALPKAEGDNRPWGNQWLKVQLVGEGAGKEIRERRSAASHNQ